jgi:hypothetical protein
VGVVVHAYNLSTREADVGGIMSLKPDWAMPRVFKASLGYMNAQISVSFTNILQILQRKSNLLMLCFIDLILPQMLSKGSCLKRKNKKKYMNEKYTKR